MGMFSNTAMLVKIPPESERKWEAMSEREIGKGETPLWVVRLLFLI